MWVKVSLILVVVCLANAYPEPKQFSKYGYPQEEKLSANKGLPQRGGNPGLGGDNRGEEQTRGNNFPSWMMTGSNTGSTYGNRFEEPSTGNIPPPSNRYQGQEEAGQGHPRLRRDYGYDGYFPRRSFYGPPMGGFYGGYGMGGYGGGYRGEYNNEM